VTGGLYELANKFTEALYSPITNESCFMKKVCILQSELSLFFFYSLYITVLFNFVIGIIAHVVALIIRAIRTWLVSLLPPVLFFIFFSKPAVYIIYYLIFFTIIIIIIIYKSCIRSRKLILRYKARIDDSHAASENILFIFTRSGKVTRGSSH